MSLKVIGTGQGRTGTTSLKFALEELGLGKCYHMIELFLHPADIKYFQQAERGEQVDWDALLNGYRSAVDFPMVRYYKQLITKYPEAKVIHTTREPESWYESFSKTILWASKPSLGRKLAMMLQLPFSSDLRKRLPTFIFNGKLINLQYGNDPANKEKVIAHYNAFNEEVLRTVPKERMLIYNVKDGWEPLCRFLNVPIPQKPFPKANTTEEFRSGKIASGNEKLAE